MRGNKEFLPNDSSELLTVGDEDGLTVGEDSTEPLTVGQGREEPSVGRDGTAPLTVGEGVSPLTIGGGVSPLNIDSDVEPLTVGGEAFPLIIDERWDPVCEEYKRQGNLWK